MLRPDATLSLTVYLLASVHSQQQKALKFSVHLIVASVLADFSWLVLFGPMPIFLTPTRSAEAPAVSDMELRFRPTAQLSYTLVVIVFKLVILVPQQPLLRAYGALRTMRIQCEDAAMRDLPTVSAGALPSLGMTATIVAAVKSFRRVRRTASNSRRDGCASLFTGSLGYALLVISFWSCLCRPDAGSMLALLVHTCASIFFFWIHIFYVVNLSLWQIITAVHESSLYFSRVTLGASLITLAIDAMWLRFQAFYTF